ncbi:hypothetical protein JKF63_06717 [Porcisia hertigi]|uniref:Elongation of fatty acids protein n=1 Tax=Porcisia hertigi TaxID=2761500 RepID=A0A836LG58_9TRYP|nr:hypothetical protein JKF63_06717 [Porcisia hertigi]
METFQSAWDWITYRPRRFKAENGRDFLDDYPDYPVYATVLYVIMVFHLPRFIASRHIHLHIRYIVAVWNLVLSLVSTYGAFHTLALSPLLFSRRSFHNAMCELLGTSNASDIITLRATRLQARQKLLMEQLHLPVKWMRSTPQVAREITSLYDGVGGFSVAMFGYLKTPELLDTLFLILQDKPVSFLHWYHHIVTAIYVWISSYRPIPSGIFFCGMNYFVHAIMYLYYFLVVMGLRKSIRPFAPVITLLQVLQMFLGMYITVYTYLQYWLGPEYSNTLFFKAVELVLSSAHYVHHHARSVVMTGALASHVPAFDMSDRFWGCDSDPTNLRVGMMMYGSYCVLFAVLFKELYLDKRVRKNSLVLARKVRRVTGKKAHSSR